MNRINNYVLNGAIALLSTAGFVACSSSDDVTDAPVNPTYDGKSVKTQFAINIATPVTGNPSTRMSGGNTQNGGGASGNTNSFLGMKNIKLIPFTDKPTVTVANPSYSAATEVAISKIISRYYKSYVNAAKAIEFVDRAYIYDNSIEDQLPRLLYRTVEGKVFKQYSENIPEWAKQLIP